jgi:molybdopterin-guanine dinucleotide biosynthesis protein A
MVDHQKQRKSKTTVDSSTNFHSETEGILYSLRYFQHENTTSIDWPYITPQKISEMTLDGHDKPNSHYLLAAWFMVCTTQFCFFYFINIA